MHQRFTNRTDLLVEATAAIPVVLHAIFHIPVSGRNVRRIDEVIKLFSKEAMSP
jgi:hypothetical protein